MMNERIRNLAKETDIWCDQNCLNKHSYNIMWENKFAELIIEECIGRCEFVADMAAVINEGEMARKTKATADSCAKIIREHFGDNSDE